MSSFVHEKQKKKNTKKLKADSVMSTVFLLIASISILTSVGIVLTLVVDASHFFQEVPLREIFSTKLAPLKENPSFGFLPLISGTFVTTLIAMMVAIPIGLTAAMYLSEFTTANRRKVLKPIIEVLAGIPTIVYGFFAYSFVTPLLMKIIPGLEAKNALSPGLVMGIMIIPLVASLSDWLFDTGNHVVGVLLYDSQSDFGRKDWK